MDSDGFLLAIAMIFGMLTIALLMGSGVIGH